MKILLFCVLLSTQCFSSVAQTDHNWSRKIHRLHGYLFCNTLDPSIGAGCYHDFLVMKRELEKIAEAARLVLTVDSFIDNSFTKANIDSVISSMSLNQSDKAIIYFSSHGYRNVGDTTIFPNVIMHDYPTAVNAAGIHEVLKKRLALNVLNAGNNLFLLTIIDACNSTDTVWKDADYYKGITNNGNKWFKLDSIKSAMRAKMLYEPLIFTAAQAENYHRLFSEVAGNIIMTSSAPEQGSYFTDRHILNGSIFTNCFIQQIEQFVNRETKQIINWNDILIAIKHETETDQVPVWVAITDFYRPFIAKRQYDEPKVNLFVTRNTDSISYTIQPKFIAATDMYLQPEFWDVMKKHTNIVTYKVYEKLGDTYNSIPKIFYAINKDEGFKLNFTGAKEFKTEAEFKMDTGEVVLVNIMNRN